MQARSIVSYFDEPSLSIWATQTIVIFTAVLCPPVSQAADYFGRKWFLVILTMFGAVGSIVIARAKSIATVLAGFCLLGCAFGAQSLLFAVGSEVVPRKHRPTVQALLNISSGIGAIIAIGMGGSLLKDYNLANYRIFYYVECGIFAAAAIMCSTCYNPPPRELQVSLSLHEKLRRLDWIGFVLLTPGLTLFSMALAWSQNPYSWKDVQILATFIIGMVLLLAFTVYEWRFKDDGMFHHALFQNRNFALTLGLIFAEGASFFTANNYFAFQYGTFHHSNLLDAGWRYSIVFVSTMFFAGIFAAWSMRQKEVRGPLVVGCLALLIFNILMATVRPSIPADVFWGYPIFAGVGLGAILPISMAAVQLSTPPELISITSGLTLSVRSLGAVVGIPVNTAVFSGTLSRQIVQKVVTVVLGLGLPPSSLAPFLVALSSGDVEGLSQIPGATPSIITSGLTGLINAYSIAFRDVWITAACFIVPALIGKFKTA